jgi:hypothetical protein
MTVLGYYVDCDTAHCADCVDLEGWEGFEDWDEPLAISAWDESDTPTHCAICESLIPHGLTSDGLAYVAEHFDRAVAVDGGRRCIVRAWVETYAEDPEARATVEGWPTSDDYSPGGTKDRRAS